MCNVLRPWLSYAHYWLHTGLFFSEDIEVVAEGQKTRASTMYSTSGGPEEFMWSVIFLDCCSLCSYIHGQMSLIAFQQASSDNNNTIDMYGMLSYCVNQST